MRTNPGNPGGRGSRRRQRQRRRPSPVGRRSGKPPTNSPPSEPDRDSLDRFSGDPSECPRRGTPILLPSVRSPSGCLSPSFCPTENIQKEMSGKVGPDNVDTHPFCRMLRQVAYCLGKLWTQTLVAHLGLSSSARVRSRSCASPAVQLMSPRGARERFQTLN